MKITDILVAEHVVFHNLFDHIEKTLPRLKTLAEVKSLAATLDALMRPHANTEDELLMGPLEHCLEQIGQRELFHEEHKEIDTELAQVQKARGPKQARELLLCDGMAAKQDQLAPASPCRAPSSRRRIH